MLLSMYFTGVKYPSKYRGLLTLYKSKLPTIAMQGYLCGLNNSITSIGEVYISLKVSEGSLE